MEAILAHEPGLRLLTAPLPGLGLDIARAERPDLILLDIQLPVVDGYAVARTLRAKPELATIPIVAVTSHAMVGDRERCLEAGCTDYIEKPIDPESFLRQITVHLPPGALTAAAPAGEG
jgi:two-component system cell cycle response regulator DivK